METWGWLIAYVVGFGLLQFLLFRYFQRDNPAPDATPGPVEGAGGSAREGPRSNDDIAGVHCRHCGTFNEHQPTFAYCKQCISPLP